MELLVSVTGTVTLITHTEASFTGNSLCLMKKHFKGVPCVSGWTSLTNSVNTVNYLLNSLSIPV